MDNITVNTTIKGKTYGELFRALIEKNDSLSRVRMIPGQKGFVYVPQIFDLEGYDNAACGDDITTDPQISDVPMELQYIYKQTKTCASDFWDTAFGQLLAPGADGGLGSALSLVSEPWMETFRFELERLAWNMGTYNQVINDPLTNLPTTDYNQFRVQGLANANGAGELAVLNAGIASIATSRSLASVNSQSGLLTQLIVNENGSATSTMRHPAPVAITYLNIVEKLSEIIEVAASYPALFTNGSASKGVFYVSSNILGLIGIANISQAFRDVFMKTAGGYKFNDYEIVPFNHSIKTGAGKDVIIFANPMDMVVAFDTKSDDTNLTIKEDVASPSIYIRAAYRMGTKVMNKEEKVLYVA